MPTTALTYRPAPERCLTSGGRIVLTAMSGRAELNSKLYTLNSKLYTLNSKLILPPPPTGRERVSIFCSGEKLADELRGASAFPVSGGRRRAPLCVVQQHLVIFANLYTSQIQNTFTIKTKTT